MTDPAGDSARLRLLYLASAAGVALLDQITKAMIAARIPLHATVRVIPGFFDLTHLRNPGAAFSLFADGSGPGRTLLLTGTTLVVLSAVLVYALRSPARDTVLQAALALISGGAVGNLIDRLREGSVTDFLRFYFGTHEWPSFNVADSAITAGVVLLAWDLFHRPDPEKAGSAGRSAA
ncbi:MAG: signal peptidase II [Thermoanaerobaculia bacterium]